MKKTGIIFICLLIFSSCSEVFEKSIATSTLTIVLPADSFKTKEYTQQFYWEKLDGATRYRLQIAKPSFASALIQKLIADTIVTTTNLTLTLNAGEYEWRIRAENAGSETNYVSRKLYILESAFNTRPMVVTKPGSSTVSMYSNGILFNWNEVIGAGEYIVQIDTMTGSFNNPVLIDTITAPQLEATVSLKKRGMYKWRMYADSILKNAPNIQSQYSTTGYIQFAMDTVSLASPASNATLSPNTAQSYDFSWDKPLRVISGETLTYKIVLFSGSNSAVVVDPNSYTVVYTGEAAKITGLTKGTVYYWSVMTTDANNVPSIYTSKRKFTAG